MSDIGPGYGVRATEGQSNGPGYGVRAYETDPQSGYGASLTTGAAPTGAVPSATLGAGSATGASSLGVSPAWLAFRRSLGIEDATDAATAQSQIDALNRRAGLARGDTIEQGVEQRQGIADNFETRGLLRSGARLRDQSKQQAGEGRALADIELTLAEQQAALMAAVAQQQAGRQRSAAETALTVADRETQEGY